MQNWDGSGGNGAALRHFEATGSKYPLVVKLGTITPHAADVFSYAPDENDMVEDPKLVSPPTLVCHNPSSCLSGSHDALSAPSYIAQFRVKLKLPSLF